MAIGKPGVQLVDNLRAHTDAYKTRKNFKKSAKNIKVNPFVDAGATSRDPYFSRDKTTGSFAWKDLLNDKNPEWDEFYSAARTFVTPDEKGFKPSDDAYKKWESFAFNDFAPGNKTGGLADRVDTADVQSFYDTYYASRLIDDETFVGSSNLRFMFEQAATDGNTESNPNEANKAPSQGIVV
jgi:hypothetical protein